MIVIFILANTIELKLSNYGYNTFYINRTNILTT